MYDTHEAEFGLLVSDTFQRQGLGTELLQRLVEVGRDEQLTRIVAQILPENVAMQRVCEKVGFAIAHEKEIVRAAIDL
jgi:acetyltransferase